MFGILVVIVVAAAVMTICRRAGYSMWWGLLALVPVLNLIFLIIFATRTWPIERELANLRLGIKTPVKHSTGFPITQTSVDTAANTSPKSQGSGAPFSSDAELIFTEASKLERQGEWEMAIALYDQLATRHIAPQNAQYARNCATNLRQRLQQRSS